MLFPQLRHLRGKSRAAGAEGRPVLTAVNMGPEPIAVLLLANSLSDRVLLSSFCQPRWGRCELDFRITRQRRFAHQGRSDDDRVSVGTHALEHIVHWRHGLERATYTSSPAETAIQARGKSLSANGTRRWLQRGPQKESAMRISNSAIFLSRGRFGAHAGVRVRAKRGGSGGGSSGGASSGGASGSATGAASGGAPKAFARRW